MTSQSLGVIEPAQNYGAPSETRTYNSIGQLTQLQSGSLNVQSAYSATQNNGKITSETDVVSGEQIAYTYDSLNRLASATSSVNPGWGQSYTYDGFGNLTNQTVTKGTAPALSVTYDPATNRQTGECADANGNLCGSGYSYDVENRLVRKGPSWSVTPDVAYSYKPGNKRVWRGAGYVYDDQTFRSLPSTDEVTFWSITGQKLVTYNLSQYQPGGYYTQPQLVATQTGTNYYFGGKLVKNSTGYVTPDRLGSIGKYFPYGQERPSATQDGKEKFATYFRDSETGLDYADQRYHQPGMGRFMTPDRSRLGVNPRDPGSWNKYAYAGGDPVNSNDPSGLYAIPVAPGGEAEYCWENPNDPDCWFNGIPLECGEIGCAPPSPPQPTAEQILTSGISDWFHFNQLIDFYNPNSSPNWTTDDFQTFTFSLRPSDIGAIGEICAAAPVACSAVAVGANGLLAFVITAAVVDVIIENAKRDIRQVNDAVDEAIANCKKAGKPITGSPEDARVAVGEEIHREKQSAGKEPSQNFTYRRLVEIAMDELCP